MSEATTSAGRERPERNLTKDTAATEPVRPYPARSSSDEQTHLVNAAPVGLVDPAGLRTECGLAVLEIYNDGRDADCEACTSDDDSDTGESDTGGTEADDKADDKADDGNDSETGDNSSDTDSETSNDAADSDTSNETGKDGR
ncbi:MAG TPA: hypothetical protein VGH99_15665 [Pseudonocardia sp.]|jgi:hypothetical protein